MLKMKLAFSIVSLSLQNYHRINLKFFNFSDISSRKRSTVFITISTSRSPL